MFSCSINQPPHPPKRNILQEFHCTDFFASCSMYKQYSTVYCTVCTVYYTLAGRCCTLHTAWSWSIFFVRSLVPLPLFLIYITPTHFSHRNTSCMGATNTDIRDKQRINQERTKTTNKLQQINKTQTRG